MSLYSLFNVFTDGVTVIEWVWAGLGRCFHDRRWRFAGQEPAELEAVV